MFNSLLIIVAAVVAPVTLPVPDFNKNFDPVVAIKAVKPICVANLMAIADGNENYLQQLYIKAQGQITEAQFRWIYTACLLYSVGVVDGVTAANQSKAKTISSQ